MQKENLIQEIKEKTSKLLKKHFEKSKELNIQMSLLQEEEREKPNSGLFL